MQKVVIFIGIFFIFSGSLFSKNISILATGGTIAGVASSSVETSGYEAASLGVAQILENVPELKNIKGVSIIAEQVFQISSQNINNDLWLQLARKVNEVVKSDNVDGVVITHGTDTLEETAYFLSLVIKTDKPIVLVGSMRPATAISADGPMNLYNSVLVASSDSAKNKGVLVVFNDNIFDARNVTKNNSYMLNAFASPNSGPIGFIHNSNVEFLATPSKSNGLDSEFNIEDIKSLPNVDILIGSSNANTLYVKEAIKAKVDSIVYAGVGNGSVSDDVLKELNNARKKGIIIVRSSRIVAGNVSRNGEVNDDTNDFIASYSLTPQKARILIMLGLTKSKDTTYLQELFAKY